MWEDTRNSRGGRWLIALDPKTDPQMLDDIWLEVVSKNALFKYDLSS